MGSFYYLDPMLRIILYIGIGGFVGSVARYYLASYVQAKFLSAWPFGTFAVNIIGCFIIGLLFAAGERAVIRPELRLMLATGLCGGLTTFSSFSLELVGLLRNGQALYAFTYAAFSVLIGLAGVWLGMVVGKGL